MSKKVETWSIAKSPVEVAVFSPSDFEVNINYS